MTHHSHFEARRGRRARLTRQRRVFQAESLEPRLLLDSQGWQYGQPNTLWFEEVRPAASSGALVGPLGTASGISGSLSVDASTTDTDRWIVRLTPQATAEIQTLAEAEEILANQSIHFSILRGLGLPGQVLVETTCLSSQNVVRALGTNRAVATFEPESVVVLPQAVPNDPLFGRQDALENTGQAGGTVDADLDASAAWDVATGNGSVVVGVIDTGIDSSHPDLAANLWVNPGEIADNGLDDDGNGFVDDVHGYNFLANNGDTRDDHRHGTHVAGTIAAVGNNGVGIAGVNWNARLMSLKFLDEHNRGVTSDAIRAVNYATMMATRQNTPINLRVLNASWGATGDYSPGLNQAIEAAGDANILVVAAAGNGNVLGRGVDNDSQPFYPASYTADNVLAVAATDQADQLAIFSNYGLNSVDVAAPGVGILSTEPGGSYATRNGTSMAAPHVSGLAALLWSVVPDATVAEVEAAIIAGVDHLDSLGSKVASGGRINAAKALAADTYVPRVALRRADDITEAGATVQEIEVSYTDNQAVDFTSLDGADLVIRPQNRPGVTYNAALARLDANSNGPTRVAIYRMAAPGGNWDALDNGVYEIFLRVGQVRDVAGNVAAESKLGSFRVDAPNEGEIRVDLLADGVDIAPGNGFADDGSGHISLRGAVQEANAQNGANTLVLGPGIYRLDRSGVSEDSAATGDLDIFERLTILGDPLGGTIIDAGGLDRLFDVQPGAELKLHFVTLRGGRTAGDGGAIRNRGVLELRQSELVGNQASRGGAIANDGELRIFQSTLADNRASASGGGLANTGDLYLENSTLSGNTAGVDGGAVEHSGGSLTLESSTLVLNSGSRGGGVVASAPATLVNTIVAKNAGSLADPDLSGSYTSLGSNLIGILGTASGLVQGVIGDKVGSIEAPLDPLLGPLARNGGPVSTHLPAPGSPAVNAGNDSQAPTVDQRGFGRLISQANRVDIGAVERVQVEIQGVKFHDVDADGVRDMEDAGLTGWTIYLDLNRNGRLDDSEPRTLTDTKGEYSFSGLEPGSYTVAEVPQAFFTPTRPRDLNLVPLPSLATDVPPNAIATGDFDRDGRPDLAVVLPSEQQVAVFTNTGKQAFSTATRYAVGVSPTAIAASDFNGDGLLDLAVANSGSNQISLLFGQTGGQFTAVTGFATTAGGQPSALATGDWDRDGDIDLAVANEALDSVTIFANEGLGTFTATGTISVGRRPRALAAAALDATAGIDLLVANSGDDSLQLLGNNGRGDFLASTPIFSGGDQPVALAAADFDADGDVDITVANKGSAIVALLLNRGDGTLASAVSFPVAAGPVALAAVDIDNDHAVDLIAASETANALSILINSRDIVPRAEGQDTDVPLPVLVVNSTNDKIDLNPGDGIIDTGTPGEITLRAAIMEANAYPGPDTITLPEGTLLLNLAGRNEDLAATGDLDISSALTIIAGGPTTNIVDANGIDRVFHVLPGGSLTLVAVQVRGGNSTGPAGGGGIRNEGHLTLDGSFVGNNRADGPGGAVLSTGSQASFDSKWSLLYDNVSDLGGGGIAIAGGTADFRDSEVVRNVSGADGGGIVVSDAATAATFLRSKIVDNDAGTQRGGGLAAVTPANVAIHDSIVQGNSASRGGALFLGDQTQLDVSGTTFVYNRATGDSADGGAIFLDSSLPASIVNSTLTANDAADEGGAIWTRNSLLDLVHVTIARNTAATGGGIAAAAGSGTTTLSHTVIVENTASTAPDLLGTFQSAGHNFIGQLDGGTGIQAGVRSDQAGSVAHPLDAKLGTYSDYGGPTGTIQPLPESPLIDAGVPTVLTTEQRGASRALDGDGDGIGRPDLGATEFGFIIDTTHDTVDANPGDGVAVDVVGNTSLRAAIMEANARGGHDVIFIPSGIYALDSELGQLTISTSVELVGSGDTTITAGGAGRVIEITATGTATIQHVTLTDGLVNSSLKGGIIYNAGSLRLDDVEISNGNAGMGGGLSNFGNAIIANSVFSQNKGISGGAIQNAGSMQVSGTVLRDSTAESEAGGLRNDGTATLVETEIVNNGAPLAAGILNWGTLRVERSTVAGNQASGAAGIYNFAALTIENSTISGNVGSHTAGAGGGVLNRGGELSIRHSTITGNSAGGSGGGIWSSASTVYLQNTIIAGNLSGSSGSPDLSGLYESGGHNLIGVNRNDTLPPWDPENPAFGNVFRGFQGFRDGVLSDRVGTEASPVDPQLGPLTDNGGPTRTHALLAGSPAIDAGSPATDVSRDQRGVPRGRDGHVDIGAFEASSETIYFVNSRADTVDANLADATAADSDGRTTLRAAVMQANARSGAEIIVVPSGTFQLTRLGTDEDASTTGDLDINGELVIFGAGAAQTTLDANQLDRGLDVRGLGPVTIDGLTVTNGVAASGGGIANATRLTLQNVAVIRNQADLRGGGVLNTGNLTMNTTDVADNRATHGGGLSSGVGASLTVVDSTWSGNVASQLGGAVHLEGEAAITGSRLHANGATDGGGAAIVSSGVLTLRQSTVDANQASGVGGGIAVRPSGQLLAENVTLSANWATESGGAIANQGNAILVNVSVIQNQANPADTLPAGPNRGAGIYTDTSTVTAVTTLRNTVVAENTRNASHTPDDVLGAVAASSSFNLVADASHAGGLVAGQNGNLVGVAPQLSPLLPSPRTTRVLAHIPLAGSPLVDAGSNALAPTVDQFGSPRPQDGNQDQVATADIGAVERYYGEIRGTVFQDLNANDVRDSGEPSLPNWTVYLDDNRNGRMDQNERRTSTDSLGEYVFPDLPPSPAYYVSILGMPGFAQTTPRLPSFSSLGTPVSVGDDWLVLDFDQDGEDDAVGFDRDRQELVVAHSDGLGGWHAPARTGMDLLDGVLSPVKSADLDLDGYPDFFTTTASTAEILVWWNEQDGTVSDPLRLPTGLTALGEVVVGEFDTNQWPDLVAGGIGPDGGELIAMQNYGSRFFNVLSRTPAPSNGPGQPVTVLAAGDLDADHRDELVVVNGSDRHEIAIISHLEAGPDSQRRTLQVGNSASEVVVSVEFGDLDRDGDSDLLFETIGSTGLVRTAFNDGVGIFGPLQSLSFSPSPSAPHLIDLDLDGDLDVIATLHSESPQSGVDGVGISLNRGDGTFDPASFQEERGSFVPLTVLAADVTGDDRLDLLAQAQCTVPPDLNSQVCVGTYVQLPLRAQVLALSAGQVIQDVGFGQTISVSVADAPDVTESSGQTVATFTIGLSAASRGTTEVHYETIEGTATAGQDYEPLTDTLTFAPGETVKTLQVPILADELDEFTESFQLRIFDAQNATLGESRGTATILDDDLLPQLSVAPFTVVESDRGTTTASFQVTLSKPSEKPVRVDFEVQDETATFGELDDYTVFGVPGRSGSLELLPGTTTASVEIVVRGDLDFEPDETIKIVLTSPVNALLNTSEATGVVKNDEPNLTVNSTLDKPDLHPGDGVVDTGTVGEITLRAAIMEAVALPGDDRVIVPTGTYRLSRTGANDNTGATGDFDLPANTGYLWIDGAGDELTTVDANQLDRVFHVFEGSELRLTGMTITGGRVTGGADGGGIRIEPGGELSGQRLVVDGNRAEDEGGGISAGGRLTLSNTTISGNHANQGGGLLANGLAQLSEMKVRANRAVFGAGIYAAGMLSIRWGELSGNIAETADGTGGALFIEGLANIEDATFSQNVAGTDVPAGSENAVTAKGGAIFVDQTAALQLGWSTVDSNVTAGSGGGIAVHAGMATLRNVTLAQNVATTTGGALWNDGGTIDSLQVTIARNQAMVGGGGIANTTAGHVVLENTLIAENAGAGGASDLQGAMDSHGHNLVGVADGGTGLSVSRSDLLGSQASPLDPLIGSLERHGGTTATIRLLLGSPAIDSGLHNTTVNLAFDQQRIARVQDGDGDGDAAVDIGAYELRANQAPALNPQTLTIDENRSANSVVGTVGVSDPDGDAVQFRIIDGNAGGWFTMDASTGVIAATGPLDHELQAEFPLTVEVEDELGLKAKNTITVVVSDLNEPPVILGGGIDDRARADGASPETFALTNVFGDPDRGDVLSFDVTSSNPALVQADINDGLLRLSLAGYAANQNRSPATITVTATDSAGLATSELFRVSVSPEQTFEYRLVLVPQPTAQTEVTTLPTSLSSVAVGQKYYAEVWLRDLLTPGTTSLPDSATSRGVEQAAVDITFLPNLSTASELTLANYSGLMMTSSGNVAQRYGELQSGRIDNFGARTLTPTRGVGPAFSRLGYIELTATTTGIQTVSLVADPANIPTKRAAAVAAGGTIAAEQIATSGTVTITIDPEGGSGATRLFLPMLTVATGSKPAALAALDLDQDGDLDLAATTGNGSTVSLLENRPGVTYQVTLAPGEVVSGLDFGDQAAAGEIHGHSFDDLNQNGLMDLGEPGLSDWSVYLDDNGNARWDSDEPRTVTDSHGEFVLRNVPALLPQRVRQIPRDGWSLTAPSGGVAEVTLKAGESRLGVDFGDRQATGGAFQTGIRGRLYEDLDGDGNFDSGEPTLGNRLVYIDLNHNGQRDSGEPQDLTDTLSGEYEFASLGTAIYTVRVELQSTETQTFPLGNELNLREFRAGDGPQAIAIGDLNADGKPDLVVANGITNNVSILMNQGGGQFATPRQEPVGFGAVAVAIADLNDDDQPDVVAVNNYSSSVTVLLNRGASGYTAATYAVGIGPRSVAVGDFDRDGDPDLAVANELSNNVSILRNSGTGVFPTRVNLAVSDAPGSLVATDMDLDGDLDLAVTAFDGDRLALLGNTSDVGTLRFAAAVSLAVGNGPFAVTAVDLNGDGADDLISANVLSDNVSILMNQGSGLFARAVSFPAGKGPTSVVGADLDEDGDVDLAVTTGTAAKLAILRNVGGNQFTAPENFGVANFPVVLPTDVAAADVDRDGSIDLAVANSESDNIGVLLNALVPGAHLVRHTEEQESVGYDFGLRESANGPTAANDDGGDTGEDTPRSVAAPGVLANDSVGAAGGILTVTRFDAVSRRGATVTVNGNGGWTYDPSQVEEFQLLAAGQSLTDDFTYQLSNGLGGTSTATVTVVVRGVNDWVNPRDPYDVNGDGFVVPLDALIVINAVNEGGARPLVGRVGPPTRYLDTNGDNFLAPLDALRVINRLNAALGEGERLDAVQDWIFASPAGSSMFVGPEEELPGTPWSDQVIDLALTEWLREVETRLPRRRPVR